MERQSHALDPQRRRFRYHGREGSHQEKESNIALAIGLADEAKAHDVFNKLSAGGNVTMPLEKQFWGALFGQFTDKYGIDWMINCG
jgi:PhnB protein